MELVFEAQSIDYLRPVFTKAAAQEQTQELIVPDSYPDCGRIVFTGACAVMRGRKRRGDRRRARRTFVCSRGWNGAAGAELLFAVFHPRGRPGSNGGHAAASLLPCALGGCAAHQFEKNSGARGCRLHADRI